MRYSAIVFAMTLLASCSSTKVIERDLNASAVSEVNDLCANGCQVSYDRYFRVDENQVNDSLYMSLKRKDVAFRLENSKVVEGRVSRVAGKVDTWLIARLDEAGGLIDTVHFRASSIESVRVFGKATADRLKIDGGVLRLDADHTMPMHTVSEITITETRKGRGRGFVIGALAGAGLGTVIGFASGDDDETEWFAFSAGEKAAAISIFLAPIGGLIGLGVGWPKIEVYRFRADTPQQMSVVIGVGPRMTQDGGAR